MTDREHSLTKALRALVASRRTAALGTLDEDGLPFVSMVPYAIDTTEGEFIIHVSGLAAHTRNLERQPNASLLVTEAEPDKSQPVHALPRLTLQVMARSVEPGTPLHQRARQTYLERFPEAEPMTQLGDFRFVTLGVVTARQIAGFGAARSLPGDDVRQALRRLG